MRAMQKRRQAFVTANVTAESHPGIHVEGTEHARCIAGRGGNHRVPPEVRLLGGPCLCRAVGFAKGGGKLICASGGGGGAPRNARRCRRVNNSESGRRLSGGDRSEGRHYNESARRSYHGYWYHVFASCAAACTRR